MLPQGNHVNNLFSRKTKFPPASLLVFLFLITENGKVASSAVSPDGVAHVRNAFGKHYEASLTDAHFHTGNSSRHDRGFCFLDGCFCLLGLSDECCGSCNPLSLLCSGGKGKCVEQGDLCGKDDNCCATNEKIFSCNSNGTCTYACTREGYDCKEETTCCDDDNKSGICDPRSKTCKTCLRNGAACSAGEYCCNGENNNAYKCSIDDKCEQICTIDPNGKCSESAECCNDPNRKEYKCDSEEMFPNPECIFNSKNRFRSNFSYVLEMT